MKHVILGTAGHVDHGKTSLVRSLTGINTDRLKEEAARGITIELGFAPFDLPDGRRVGIVDVVWHGLFGHFSDWHHIADRHSDEEWHYDDRFRA